MQAKNDMQKYEELKATTRTGLCALAVVAVVMVASAHPAWAGTGGSAFDDVWTTLKDWTQGNLGRIVSGSMILVGIVGGIAKQSLMSFALGLGGGMGLYNSPTIVESIMSATLPHAEKVSAMATHISNGLSL